MSESSTRGGLNDGFVYQPPQSPYLEVLYQDDALCVLNKPAGLLSVPGRLAEHQDSLALRALRVLPDARVVHRLDMATSGVIVLALGLEAQRSLSRQFQQRTTDKTYHALVLGQPGAHPEDSKGSVDLPLRCDWPNRPRQMVCYEHGKPALTHWRLLKRFVGYSLVELKPVTGRSHQLRVHMQQLGCPIVGDGFYAPAHSEQPLGLEPRLHLHASELELDHPISGERLKFCAPLPFADPEDLLVLSSDAPADIPVSSTADRPVIAAKSALAEPG